MRAEQTRNQRKRPRFLLLAVALTLSGLAAYAAWQLVRGLPGDADFYLHKEKYEGVVAKAKALPLEPGAQTDAMLEGFKVNVGRGASGSYTVTITTADWHHAGAYGYVFSDVPLTPRPDPHYPDFQGVDNPGDMPFVDKGIIGQGGRWWSVYNDLL
ncbi:MAG: hypothetical protein JOZ96_12045 [Acidobacteria bacterium]|nr:hypothetical protein [Acidobacteriota bacterium]